MVMIWRNPANEVGRAHRGIAAAVLTAALALLWTLPGAAGDIADGLSAQSSWADIWSRAAVRPKVVWEPSIEAPVPQLNFGKAYVSLTAVCRDGDLLRIADPHMDNGVRVSAANFPGQLASRPSGAKGTGPFAAAEVTVSDQRPAAPLRYAITVYRVVQTPQGTYRVALFTKDWEVPTCEAQ
jgi:hypothetical protein